MNKLFKIIYHLLQLFSLFIVVLYLFGNQNRIMAWNYRFPIYSKVLLFCAVALILITVFNLITKRKLKNNRKTIKIVTLFFVICTANAQTPKITTKNFNLIGKVKKVLETAEKQGDLITEMERADKNTFYDEAFSPIVGSYTFNEDGYILEKRGFPAIDKKTLYIYNASNDLVSETTYNSQLNNNENTPTKSINYIHKKDTIVYTQTILDDVSIKPVIVYQVFKNKLIVEEYTEQKIINYSYDNKGTLIKKEGWRKKKSQAKKNESFEIIYENGIMISSFCPEENVMRKFYPNGLLKSYKSNNRYQEFVYTFDKNGNWITNTITLDGKPSVKYYRIIEYFE